MGIPLHYWDLAQFSKIVESFGVLLILDERTKRKSFLQWARMKVLLKSELPARLTLVVDNLVFNVECREEGGLAHPVEDLTSFRWVRRVSSSDLSSGKGWDNWEEPSVSGVGKMAKGQDFGSPLGSCRESREKEAGMRTKKEGSQIGEMQEVEKEGSMNLEGKESQKVGGRKGAGEGDSSNSLKLGDFPSSSNSGDTMVQSDSYEGWPKDLTWEEEHLMQVVHAALVEQRRKVQTEGMAESAHFVHIEQAEAEQGMEKVVKERATEMEIFIPIEEEKSNSKKRSDEVDMGVKEKGDIAPVKGRHAKATVEMPCRRSMRNILKGGGEVKTQERVECWRLL